VLLVGDLGLVVEVFSSQSLELLTGVLLALCGRVVVAQSTFALSVSRYNQWYNTLNSQTYALKPRILLAFSSGASPSILACFLRVDAD
jgi:hypothetical protein